MALEARLAAPVRPTEDEAKVAAAVRRLFPDAALQRTAAGLEGPARDLGPLARLIRDQRIPDTARGVLLRGQDGARTRFALNKQAAAAGRLNFATREGPLGDLQVEVRAASGEELQAWLDQVAPDTRGWSLEDRGLTPERLQQLDLGEASLDAMEREVEAGPQDAAPGGSGRGAETGAEAGPDRS